MKNLGEFDDGADLVTKGWVEEFALECDGADAVRLRIGGTTRALTASAVKGRLESLREPWAVPYDVDTSRAKYLVASYAAGGALTSYIGFHNTAQKLVLSPQANTEWWVDAVGKHQLCIGTDGVTYDTHALLHTGNVGSLLNASDIPGLGWDKIVSGKPTTLSGYGITDAVSLTGDQTVAGIKTFTSQVRLGSSSYYLGVGGAASKLGSLTLTGALTVPSVTSTGKVTSSLTTDYSVSEGVVSAALDIRGGAYIAKKLYVGGELTTHAMTPDAARTRPIGTATMPYGPLHARELHLYDTVTYDEGTHVSDVTLQLFGLSNSSDTVKGWKLYSYEDAYYYPLVIGTSYAGYMGALTYTGSKTYSGATNSGYWGIGIADPLYLLHVNGTLGAGATTVASLTSTGVATFSAGLTVASGQKIGFNGGTSDYLEVKTVGGVRYLHTNLPFYSDSSVSGGGVSDGVPAGSSVVETVLDWSHMGDALSAGDAGTVFNAHAVQKVYDYAVTLGASLSGVKDGTATLDGVKIAPGGSLWFLEGGGSVYNVMSWDEGSRAALLGQDVTLASGKGLFVAGNGVVAKALWGGSGGEVYVGNSSRSASLTLYGSSIIDANGGNVKGVYEYNLTTVFGYTAGTSIPTSVLNLPNFLTNIANGRARLHVRAVESMNGVSYNVRLDVHVGSRGSSSILLYYYSCPNSGTVEVNFIEIGYSSGWKVLAKYTKAL
ncbi:MAG: hypothetical protein K6B45_04835 [Bacteroidaceae bacterium]|nr:hypothetical protein [Bacteroidaceae bacterium]